MSSPTKSKLCRIPNRVTRLPRTRTCCGAPKKMQRWPTNATGELALSFRPAPVASSGRCDWVSFRGCPCKTKAGMGPSLPWRTTTLRGADRALYHWATSSRQKEVNARSGIQSLLLRSHGPISHLTWPLALRTRLLFRGFLVLFLVLLLLLVNHYLSALCVFALSSIAWPETPASSF